MLTRALRCSSSVLLFAALVVLGCGESGGGGGGSSGTGGNPGGGGTTGGGGVADFRNAPMGPVLDATFDCVLLEGHQVICAADDFLLEELTGERNSDEQLFTVPLDRTPERRPVELAGRTQSHCARMSDGTVECWGQNRGGTLGDGSPTMVDGPNGRRPFTRVEAGPAQGVNDSVRLVGTDENMCSLGQDGRVLCWGGMSFGAPGTPVPEDIAAPNGVVDLAFSENDVLCVLLNGGPVRCQFDETWEEIPGTLGAARLQENCALFGAARPVCWGSNITDSWGGETADVGTFPLDDVVNVAAFSGGNLALTGDGALWRCVPGGCRPVELPCDLTADPPTLLVRMPKVEFGLEPLLIAYTPEGYLIGGAILPCGGVFADCTTPDAIGQVLWYVNHEDAIYRSDLDPACAFPGNGNLCTDIAGSCPPRPTRCGSTTNDCQ